MFTTIPTRKGLNTVAVNVPQGFVFQPEKPKERKKRSALPKGELFDRKMFAEPLMTVIRDSGGKVEGVDEIAQAIDRVKALVEKDFKSADWELYETRKESRWRIALKWVVFALRKEGALAPAEHNRLCWEVVENN